MKNHPPKTKHAGILLLLAIASLCFWPATPATAQTSTNQEKLVVTMDTPLYPYDPENQGRRANTAEIVAILKDVTGLSVVPVDTSLAWKGERDIKAKNPDLIIIHFSAFATSQPANERAADDKFNSFLLSMANSKALFLVYTRTRFPDLSAGYKLMVERWVRIVPQLRGRIEVFEFPPGSPYRFRNRAVREALKLRVKLLLGLS